MNPPSLGSWTELLYHFLPSVWSSFLRLCSPIFVLLEGLASLLVCQALGKTTKGWLEEGEREGHDVRGLFVLVLSSSTYVASIAALIRVSWTFISSFMNIIRLTSYSQIFPPPPDSSALPSFLLGIALTTTFFLTIIGFSLRRTNVVETSLVMAYVTWSVWLLSVEGGTDAEGHKSQGWSIGSGRQPGWDVGMDLGSLLGFAFGQVTDVVFGL